MSRTVDGRKESFSYVTGNHICPVAPVHHSARIYQNEDSEHDPKLGILGNKLSVKVYIINFKYFPIKLISSFLIHFFL